MEQELGAEYRDLEDLLREPDFVSLHVSLIPQTRHLINTRRLALMKPTAVLVNTSRSPVLDEQAPAGRSARARSSPQGLTCSSESRKSIPDCSPAAMPCSSRIWDQRQ